MNRPAILSRLSLLPALCVLLLAAPAVWAADRIAAGQWESTMTTDGATSTAVYCLGAEQAAATNADAKAGREFAEKKAGARCAMKSYEANGDTVSYSMVCGDRAISDTTRFHGSTSEGVKKTTFDGKTATTNIKSRRLGACP